MHKHPHGYWLWAQDTHWQGRYVAMWAPMMVVNKSQYLALQKSMTDRYQDTRRRTSHILTPRHEGLGHFHKKQETKVVGLLHPEQVTIRHTSKVPNLAGHRSIMTESRLWVSSWSWPPEQPRGRYEEETMLACGSMRWMLLGHWVAYSIQSVGVWTLTLNG